MMLSRASRRRENFPAPRQEQFPTQSPRPSPKILNQQNPTVSQERHHIKSCRIVEKNIESRLPSLQSWYLSNCAFLPCRQVHNRPIQKHLRLFRGRTYTIKSRRRLEGCHPAAFKAGGIQRPTEDHSAKTLVNNHSRRSATAFAMLIEVRGIRS